MKIAVGSDHRGLDQRSQIISALESMGHTVNDCGSHSTDSCDYPDIAEQVAGAVSRNAVDAGILICGTGIGVSIAANKVRGIRAAVANDLHAAEYSRRHNDANVLCLSADLFAARPMVDIVRVWLETEFDGGRHQRRVDKIMDLEKKHCESTTDPVRSQGV